MAKPVSYTQDLKARGFETVRGRMTMKAHPDAIVVEGVDTEEDESNPLYDPRAVYAARLIAPYYDPSFVLALAEGSPVDDPIQCVVRNGKLTAKDGRRRIIHSRIAKVTEVEFLIDDAEGLDDKALFLAVRACNARRLNPSPIMQARELSRARKAWGCTVAEFAANEGLAEPVMRQRMSLLFLAPELQDLLDLPETDDNHLDFSVGIQLSKILKGKGASDEARFAAQMEVYKRLLAAGSLTAAAVRREKAALNTDDTADGPEDAAEGGDSSEAEDDQPKAEKQPKGHLSTAELRKIVKAVTDGQLTLDPVAFETIKAILGMANKGVRGMKEARALIRGE